MTTNTKRKTEKGNVLFLILIAVALFAALSYVVTQSTRSGSGSTEREKNILSGAQMTQYPTALRTAIIRMVLGGTPVELVRFNDPSNLVLTSINQMVFHPQGGGAGFQNGDPTLSSTGQSDLTWSFNANFDVPGIGLSGAGGNDVIAFLPGISAAICRQVNDNLAITGCTLNASNLPAVPAATEALINQQMRSAPAPIYTFPTTDQVDLQCTGGTATTGFARQASGCFTDAAGRFVYYSVLMER